MRSRSRAGGLLTVVLTLALVALGGVGLLSTHLVTLSSSAPASTAIVVVARDISVAHVLTSADLATTVLPAGTSLGQTIPAADEETILGQRAQVPLYAGEPLDSRDLYADAPVPPSPLDLMRIGETEVTVHALSLSVPLGGLPSDSTVAIYATTQRAPLTTTVQSAADAQTLQTSRDEVTLITPAARVVDYEAAQGAISLIVPRAQASTLYLLEDTAILHFALVRPDDHTVAGHDTMDTRRFSQEYHVPTR
jgi:hypothetical protein